MGATELHGQIIKLVQMLEYLNGVMLAHGLIKLGDLKQHFQEYPKPFVVGAVKDFLLHEYF